MRPIGMAVAQACAGFAATTLAGALLMWSVPSARAQAPAPTGGGNVVTFAAGWNLVALPPGTDLSKVTSSMYTLQAGDTDYETIDPAQGSQAGFGYWAYFGASTSITLAAGSTDLYAIFAPGQYVMVGNPSGTEPALVSGADSVATYDPVAGYGTSALLNPGQGAWAFSASGGPITVTPTAAAEAPPPAGARPPAGRLYGTVTVNGSPATGGTSVTAKAAGGATCGSTTVGAAPASGSNYALDLTGTDSGCTTSGAPLNFTVGSSAATPSGSATIPDVSGATHIDLTVP